MAKFNVWTFLILFFLGGWGQGNATEYQPWLGNLYEFELRPSLRYQDYTWLASGSHLNKYTSNDVFLNVSLSNARPDLGAEVEILQARTRRQRGDIDQVKLTGRYVWLDDVAGDAWSLITGLSYIQAFRHSLKDVSSFHHGQYEAEVFFSIGREVAEESMWGSRWWSVMAMGIAERGLPWMRLNVAYEKRWWIRHETKLFCDSLWGFGDRKLRLNHFQGYGLIRHQSIDIGLRYTYLLEYFGSASLEYSYRIYACNFPVYTHHVMAQFLYTFGL